MNANIQPRQFSQAEQQTGGSKWPTKVSLTAHVGEAPAARLDVLMSKTGRKAYVDRLETQPDHRGQGHASALMDEFQTRNPNTSIDHGDRTDDGKAWWGRYSGGKKVVRGRTIL